MPWVWSLRAYNENGQSILDEWYREQTGKVRAAFRVRMQYLLQNKREKWVRPYYAPLKGACLGLGEVRIHANRVQHRPIGFVEIEAMEFTLVAFAREKGGKFIPGNTCSVGQRRKMECQNDRGATRECQWIRGSSMA